MSQRFWLLVVVIAACAGVAESSAALAPAGPRLAFVRISRPPGKGRAFDLLTAGPFGGKRQLLTGTSRAGGVVPFGRFAWSPDGTSLALSATTSEHALLITDLYLIASDGSALRRLTSFGDATAPVFSVDGKTIYFARSDQGNARFGSSIWSIGSDGTGLRQLTPPRSMVIDWPSSVSPSGDQLALTHIACSRNPFRCGTSARTLSLTGGDEHLLARNAFDPVFAPDGTRIALTSYRDRNGRIELGKGQTSPANELYVLNAATGNLQRLTRTKDLSEGSPSWDPSGKRLAYYRQGDSFSQRILVMNADGTCKTVLFKRQTRRGSLSDDYTWPAWQPGPGREAGRIAC